MLSFVGPVLGLVLDAQHMSILELLAPGTQAIPRLCRLGADVMDLAARAVGQPRGAEDGDGEEEDVVAVEPEGVCPEVVGEWDGCTAWHAPGAG